MFPCRSRTYRCADVTPLRAHGISVTHSDLRASEILDIVARETGIERSRLVPSASVGELGIASLDMVQAIFALETRYGVDIPVVSERTGSEFNTVGELVDHVLASLDAQRPARNPP